MTLTANLRTANEYAAERRSRHKQLITPMEKVSPFNLDLGKNRISVFFVESPDFVFMSLQIFLYQGLASLQMSRPR